MKKLKNHILVYDDECPLCIGYTSLFVKSGMLAPGGRQKYGSHLFARFPQVDWARARNEIALINTNDHYQVTYGIESLVKVLGNNFPILERMYRFRIVQFLLTQLYYFISYNRKVIMPGPSMYQECACTPDRKTGYQWAYIILTWLVTSVILTLFSYLLINWVAPSVIYREMIICGGQILFQGSLVFFLMKERWLEYLGTMMTVSLIGAFLLIPGILLIPSGTIPFFSLLYFIGVVVWMFFEHKRRVRIMGLPVILSFTWVLYRICILLIIL